jgi:hypothetical protein
LPGRPVGAELRLLEIGRGKGIKIAIQREKKISSQVGKEERERKSLIHLMH